MRQLCESEHLGKLTKLLIPVSCRVMQQLHETEQFAKTIYIHNNSDKRNVHCDCLFHNEYVELNCKLQLNQYIVLSFQV